MTDNTPITDLPNPYHFKTYSFKWSKLWNSAKDSLEIGARLVGGLSLIVLAISPILGVILVIDWWIKNG